MNERIYYYAAFFIFFILAIVFSTLINGLFLRFSRTLGIRQTENENIVRWASTAKPSVGGFSFFIVFLISVSGFAIFDIQHQDFLNKQLIGVLLSSVLGFLVGLADDSYDTNPLLKFMGQFMCAVILIATGVYVHVSGIFVVDAAFTVFWVVGIMNSINMLDNMDGITASTALAIFSTCLLVSIFQGHFFHIYSFILIGLIGSILGFLYYNINPSKMYMGDTGSQFLGVMLASMSMLLLWNFRDNASGNFELKQFLIPVFVFAVPIIDTTTVALRRLARGQSPFVGGKDHTTHHLVYLGFSDLQVMFILFFISSVCSLAACVMVNNFHHITLLQTGILLLLFFVLFLGMQVLYDKGRKKQQLKLASQELPPKENDATPKTGQVV